MLESFPRTKDRELELGVVRLAVDKEILLDELSEG